MVSSPERLINPSSSKYQRLAAFTPGNLMWSSSPSCVSFDDLPEDVKCYIMHRLEEESLRCFKLTCKTARSLIASSVFLDYRRKTTVSGDDETLIVHGGYNKTVSLLDRHTFQRGPVFSLPFREHQYAFEKVKTVLVGCGGGIVCLLVYEEEWNENLFNLHQCSFYFWNPKTKHFKHIVLPPPDWTLNNEIHGAGFDHISEDMKLVRVVGFPVVAQVISMKNDVWRDVALPTDDDQFPFMSTSTVCVDGFLCWNGYECIMAFDLHNEVFHSVTELPVIHGVDSRSIRITNCNGSMGMVYCNRKDGKIRLWKLDDAQCLGSGSEVKPSWTLVLNIIIKAPVHFVHSFFNDHFLLVAEFEGFLSFWLVNSLNRRGIKLPVSNCYGQIHKYTRSLLSIPGSTTLEDGAA